jgi:hypothetical protein
VTKVLLLALSLALPFTLTGCGKFDRGVAKITGSAQVCVDGVLYLQFTSGASVKYNRDGTVATC